MIRAVYLVDSSRGKVSRPRILIKFGRFMRLIELINYLRSSVHADVLCLRRLTKRISNRSEAKRGTDHLTMHVGWGAGEGGSNAPGKPVRHWVRREEKRHG